MSHIALAVRDLERDAAPAASLRVICSGCDPDSPRSVPREKCQACGGSGLVPPAVATIASELRDARLQLLRGDDDFDD